MLYREAKKYISGNWRTACPIITKINDSDIVLRLLDYERETQNRGDIIRRLQSRYRSLRTIELRQEVI